MLITHYITGTPEDEVSEDIVVINDNLNKRTNFLAFYDHSGVKMCRDLEVDASFSGIFATADDPESSYLVRVVDNEAGVGNILFSRVRFGFTR